MFFFFFLICKGSLIWQIFDRHTTLLVFFCYRVTFGEGGEKETENAKGKLDQTTPTFQNPKIHVCMSELARRELKSQL